MGEEVGLRVKSKAKVGSTLGWNILGIALGLHVGMIVGMRVGIRDGCLYLISNVRLFDKHYYCEQS